MTALTNHLAEIVRRTLHIDDERIPDFAHFVRDLGADSLECVELMMEIEDVFELEFPDEDLPELTTLAAVAKYLRERVSELPSVSSLTSSFSIPEESAA